MICTSTQTNTNINHLNTCQFIYYLNIFMTRHVISKVVNTQIKIEMFLMVGRSLKMVEMRDPTAASVVLGCDE